MSTEGYPGLPPEEGAGQTFDFEQALLTTGLSPEDLSQEVRFGNYQGTLASALNPATGCPLRGMVEKAYIKGGIEEVQQTFTVAGMMDEAFKPTISPKTFAYHAGEVDGTEILRGAKVEPDFLG